MMNQIQKRMKLIHGLSNETRLEVLELLKSGEQTVSELLDKVDCTQSNLSQHLACLKECGFITGRQSGKYVYYTLANQKLLKLLDLIDNTIPEMHWDIKDELECQKHIN
ncbi:MAG: metalloregulator ArsR/SmtB family transcription factor [Streptococcaceae bacterium]|nr:metalloregulator ArsR/SmtB family transcription factor [Streptococcaceae bacterium]